MAAACCSATTRLAGKFYLTTERLLMLRGDLFLFESAFSADVFRRKIGDPRGLVRIVHNGVSHAEFEPVGERSPTRPTSMFLGELRPVKGIDVLIDAIAQLHRDGRNVTATLVGDGPDERRCRLRSTRYGLNGAVRFQPAMPARQALTLGRIMVVPSRANPCPTSCWRRRPAASR